MKKIKAEDWLIESTEETPLSFGANPKKVPSSDFLSKTNFEKKEKIFAGKNGKLLFELQKTFKGDSRFVLTNEFIDDVDPELLPENVKMNFERTEDLIVDTFVPMDELEKQIRLEELNYKRILDSLFEEKDKQEKNRDKKVKFSPVQRFDPSSARSVNLVIKTETMAEAKKKIEKLEMAKKRKFKKSELVLNSAKQNQNVKKTKKEIKQEKKEQKEEIEKLNLLSKPKVFEIDVDHFKKHLIGQKTGADKSGFTEFKLFQ